MHAGVHVLFVTNGNIHDPEPGGITPTTNTEVVFLGLAGSKSCERLPEIPVLRSAASTGLSDGEPVICGGYDLSIWYDDCYRFEKRKIVGNK